MRPQRLPPSAATRETAGRRSNARGPAEGAGTFSKSSRPWPRSNVVLTFTGTLISLGPPSTYDSSLPSLDRLGGYTARGRNLKLRPVSEGRVDRESRAVRTRRLVPQGVLSGVSSTRRMAYSREGRADPSDQPLAALWLGVGGVWRRYSSTTRSMRGSGILPSAASSYPWL